MTTEKFSNGAVKDFQVGDRVVWDKAGNSIYEVVKISGEGITISLLESHPRKGSIHPKAKRRVSLNEIEPLDIGSNDQHDTKSSRGFVNNYSPLVLGETNLYASVFPLELKSSKRECSKKVLGDFNYLAPVFPLELKQRQSLVKEKANSYAFVIPLEPEQNLVLGDNQNNSVIKPKPPTKRKASGWLERYTKTKKVKGGNSVTYPRVEGEREPNNSEHWYFAYRWEEKRDTAKSDNGYVTRAVSLPKNKVAAVQIAIARKWSQEKILSFIQGEET